MILAIKKENTVFISSDEILKNGIIEIDDGYGKTVYKKTFLNTDFETIEIKKEKFTLRIKSNQKLIYQKTFTN